MTGRLHRTWAVMEGRHLVSFHRTEEAARRAARGRSIGFVLRQAGNYEVMLGNDGVPLPLALDFLGAPGCSIYTNVLALDGAILDAAGSMRVHLAIPNLPPYLGARIYHQGVVLDPTASAFGFVFSGGYEVVLGG